MKFYADWRTYNTRYGMGLTLFIGMLLFMIIRPISAGEGFMFFEMFSGMLLRDIRLTGIFFTVCLYGQLIGYFVARDYVKSLELLDDELIFNLFNKTKIKLKFSEIHSLEYTNDMFKNFEFILKNGEKKIIYATIKNKHQALKLIQQKIQECAKI